MTRIDTHWTIQHINLVDRGRVVEVYGPEGSGKTTVCQHIVAEAQRQALGLPAAAEGSDD